MTSCYRPLLTWNYPFCVELKEGTFSLLLKLLEKYCNNFDGDAHAPFESKR